jgi:hypothetical protein
MHRGTYRLALVNEAVFLAIVALTFAGRQLVAVVVEHEHDLGYALSEVAYALVVVAPVPVVLLVPGLLFLAEAAHTFSLLVVRALSVPIAALAFAPFFYMTGTGAEIIPLAVGAIAFAALLRLPTREVLAGRAGRSGV